MLVTLAAAWLVTSSRPSRRLWGFRLFIVSNGLWIAWGLFSHAYALVVLQVGLFLINWRGTTHQPEVANEVDRG